MTTAVLVREWLPRERGEAVQLHHSVTWTSRRRNQASVTCRPSGTGGARSLAGAPRGHPPHRPRAGPSHSKEKLLQGATRWLAIAIASLIALPALAAKDEDDFDQKMLDVLLEQGTITEEQYRELSETAEAEELPPVSAECDWKFRWDNGFKLDSPDGETKLKFGGRIQVDAAATFASHQITSNAYGTEFRRARLFFSGSHGEHLFFKAQYDFAGDNGATWARTSRTSTSA